MDSLQTVTLVTAIWGAVTGTAAIVWGIWQFVLSGPRVKAEILQGMAAGDGTLITGPQAWTQQHPIQVFPVLVLVARNTGRAPIDITHIGVELERGTVIRQFRYYGDSPPLPHRLEAGSKGTWVMDVQPIVAAVKANMGALGTGSTARAQFELGTGKLARSRKGFSIPT